MPRRITQEIERWIREVVDDEVSHFLDREGVHVQQTQEQAQRHMDRVVRAFNDKGYLLELQAYFMLVERGWDATLQETFWDIETDATQRPWREYLHDVRASRLEKDERGIDVKASKETPSIDAPLISAEIELVVECKHRTRENWIFYQEPLVTQEMRESIIQQGGPLGTPGSIDTFSRALTEIRFIGENCKPSDLLGESVIRKVNLASHHSPQYLEIIAKKGYALFGKEDSLFDACMQVLDAAVFRRASHTALLLDPPNEYRNNVMHFRRIYPVVLFSGPIISVHQDGGEPVFNESPWVTLSILRKNYKFYIDVVQSSSFDDYLNMLELENDRIGSQHPP